MDHTPGPAQHWSQCDPDIRDFVLRISAQLAERLGRLLVGVYLHGSLASGCYRRPKSDVDLLAVVRGRLDRDLRRDVARALVRLSDARPTTADMDVHVVAQRYLDPFAPDAPIEAHYSEERREGLRRGEVEVGSDAPDPDLAAVCTAARERGISLLGPPPAAAIGAVAWGA